MENMPEEYHNPIDFLQDPATWGASRTRVILAMLAMSFSYKQIAKVVGVHPSSVKNQADKYMVELNASNLSTEELRKVIDYVGLPSGKKAIIKDILADVFSESMIRCKVIGLSYLGFSDQQIGRLYGVQEPVIRSTLSRIDPSEYYGNLISGTDLIAAIDKVGYPENRRREK